MSKDKKQEPKKPSKLKIALGKFVNAVGEAIGNAKFGS